jgi:hypothetical protein
MVLLGRQGFPFRKRLWAFHVEMALAPPIRDVTTPPKLVNGAQTKF